MFQSHNIKYAKKMKTLTKGILGTAIAVACVYCGYATYDSYIYQQENALLLANVEALGQNEAGDGGGSTTEPSVCKGFKIYSEVGIRKGTEQERMHLNDSTDIITDYSVEKCYAEGSGTLEGNDNLVISQYINNVYIGKCTH